MSRPDTKRRMALATAASIAIILALFAAGHFFLRGYLDREGRRKKEVLAPRIPAAVPPGILKSIAHPGRVEVRAAGPDGRPLEGARVRMYSVESALLREKESGTEGKAVFRSVPTGRYCLAATAGMLVMHRPVCFELTAESKKDVTVTLEPGLTLEGRVTAHPGGAPVPDACLSINAVGKNQAFMCGTSGEEGRFRFGPLAPGKYSITASGEGFQTERIPRLEITADAPPAPVAVELLRLVEVEGKVLSPDGTPVPGAELSLQRAGEGKSPAPAFVASFQDIELPPPLSHARLIPSGHLGIMKGPVPDFSDTPRAGEAEEAAAGPARGSGICPCMKGLTVIEASVSAATDGSGAFTLNVDPTAPLSIVITHPQYAPERLEKLEVRSLERSGGITVTMRSGTEIRGTLTDAEGCRPAGAQLWMDLEDYGVVADIEVEPDGGFTIPHAAGTVELHANAPRFAAAVKRFEAERLQPGSLVEITLMRDETLIHARVVDKWGFPIEGAKIKVREAGSGKSATERTAFSDSDGMFSFVTLPPGVWKIAIEHPAYRTLAAEVPPWEGEEEFSLLAPGGICGKVTDDGTYLPVEVFTLLLDSEQGPAPTASFSGGEYRWTDLPAGEALLEVRAEGYLSQERQLTIPQGEEKHECTLEDLDFWLIPKEP